MMYAWRCTRKDVQFARSSECWTLEGGEGYVLTVQLLCFGR